MLDSVSVDLLPDVPDPPLIGKKYLLLDRDTKYCAAFRQMLVREGIRVIRLPPMSPNLNAYAERFVRSIKDECLDRMISPYNAHSAQDVNRFWENATVMPPRLRGQRGSQRTPTMRAVAQDDSAPCRLLLQRSAGLQSHYLERGAP